MTKFIQAVLRSLNLLDPVPTREELDANIAAIHASYARDVNRRFSRGNVLLQQGSYYTKKDVDDALRGNVERMNHNLEDGMPL